MQGGPLDLRNGVRGPVVIVELVERAGSAHAEQPSADLDHTTQFLPTNMRCELQIGKRIRDPGVVVRKP